MMSRKYRDAWKKTGGGQTPPLFLLAIWLQAPVGPNDSSAECPMCQVLNAEELTMKGIDPNQPTQSEQDHEDPVKRHPDEADEDQLDEALEETFPASDPISP